jgi:hypothetical protein
MRKWQLWGLRYLITLALVVVGIATIVLYETALRLLLRDAGPSTVVNRSALEICLFWLATMTGFFAVLKLQIPQLQVQPFLFAAFTLAITGLSGIVAVYFIARFCRFDFGWPGSEPPPAPSWMGLCFWGVFVTSLLLLCCPLT